VKDFVNGLVLQYQQTKDNDIFEMLYDIIAKDWDKRSERVADYYGLDHHDVREMYDMKLWRLLDTYDPSKGNFQHALNRAIRYGLIDIIRKTKTRYSIEFYEPSYFDEGDAENDSPSFFDKVMNIDDLPNAEAVAIEKLQKERDQRRLVAILYERADDYTRRCITAYLIGGSYEEAAKLLGTCNRSTVFRRIKRLSRHFNADKMGDFRDYFTELTRPA
jgi:DNA-directed RNA polymerase specialized sigma24 family protein